MEEPAWKVQGGKGGGLSQLPRTQRPKPGHKRIWKDPKFSLLASLLVLYVSCKVIL